MKGKSNREIATELGIMESTVKCHVSLILMRLNVNDRTQAVVTALQSQNHRPTSGLLGPNTWGLAWTGTYHAPVTAPKWTAPQYYSQGDSSATIKANSSGLAHFGNRSQGVYGSQ